MVKTLQKERRDLDAEMRRAIGWQLRTARKAKGLTLMDVAKHIGGGALPDRIGEYERGNNLPLFPRLVRICRLLDINLESLADQVMRHSAQNKGPTA